MENVSKSTWCRALQGLARHVKPNIHHRLKVIQKEKRLNWASEYMKLYIKEALFTDECRATLDGPDGWSKGWVSNRNYRPIRIRRRQGGGGIMFWAGIIGNELVCPWKVPEGVKMTSVAYVRYVTFLKEHHEPWFKSKPLSLKRKMIHVHANGQQHFSRRNLETY